MRICLVFLRFSGKIFVGCYYWHRDLWVTEAFVDTRPKGRAGLAYQNLVRFSSGTNLQLIHL
jgi:hypothetical protein